VRGRLLLQGSSLAQGRARELKRQKQLQQQGLQLRWHQQRQHRTLLMKELLLASSILTMTFDKGF
jgi:hypothetical protein